MSEPLLPALVLVGGGGHAVVIADAVMLESTFALLGYLDKKKTKLDQEIPRIGPIKDLQKAKRFWWILAMGDLQARRSILESLEPEVLKIASPPVVHPFAIVSPSAEFQNGVFVAAGAIVQARAHIGDHAIINTGAIVEHDCFLCENTHIAPGAALGGEVTIGTDTLIGLGARVKPGVKIGKAVTVGVGAVVIEDVPDGQTVVGVPARAIERAEA